MELHLNSEVFHLYGECSWEDELSLVRRSKGLAYILYIYTHTHTYVHAKISFFFSAQSC